MRCPFCDADSNKVIDSRPAEQGSAIRRRRACASCDQRFTTYERLEAPLMVRKRDGRLQLFQPHKVRAGIVRALADAAVSDVDIDAAVAELEASLRALGPEVTTDDIANHVLSFLRKAGGDAAYLRFASVYKEFRDARDFEREVAALERSD